MSMPTGDLTKFKVQSQLHLRGDTILLIRKSHQLKIELQVSLDELVGLGYLFICCLFVYLFELEALIG